MKDLIKKLEEVPKGSRELDSFLADGLDWHSANPEFAYVRYWRQFDPKNHSYESISWSPPDDWGGGPWGTKLPHYTTSLDAALPWESIVEAKLHESPDGDEPYWTALHCAPGQAFAGSTIQVYEGRGCTEAIARRLAALKAQEKR